MELIPVQMHLPQPVSTEKTWTISLDHENGILSLLTLEHLGTALEFHPELEASLLCLFRCCGILDGWILILYVIPLMIDREAPVSNSMGVLAPFRVTSN